MKRNPQKRQEGRKDAGRAAGTMIAFSLVDRGRGDMMIGRGSCCSSLECDDLRRTLLPAA
jgi:hypothetical protein